MYRSLFCVMFVASLTLGCGGGGEPDTSVSAGTSTNPNGAAATGGAANTGMAPIPANHVLVGNWMGQLLATPDQLKEMGIDSITLELEFANDGEMGMLAIMKAGDIVDEQPGFAKWTVAKQEGNQYTIESREDGTGELQELVVQLEDPETIVVNAAQGGMFRLKRMTAEQVQARMAERIAQLPPQPAGGAANPGAAPPPTPGASAAPQPPAPGNSAAPQLDANGNPTADLDLQFRQGSFGANAPQSPQQFAPGPAPTPTTR